MVSLAGSEASQGSIPSQVAEEVVLRACGLRKAFGGQVVLADVSVKLHRGEVVLLRGDNGSGKTTLLNILTGNFEPDAGWIALFEDGAGERFAFPRRWWLELNPFDHFTPERMATGNVGRTWQDIRLFSTQDLRDNLALAMPGQLGEKPLWAVLRRSSVRRQEATNLAAAEAMLASLGLAGRERSSAGRISLGQSKRVAIARAVRAGAKILFLDEPLAGLDVEGIEQVLGLLETLARDQNITLVIVEHVFHIPRLLDLVNTVWTLTSGHVTIQKPSEVRASLGHTGDGGLRKWLTELAGPGGDVSDREFTGGAVLTTVVPAGRLPGKTVLKVDELVVHRGDRLIVGYGRTGLIDGLTFSLREGELAILQAPNGWGKTTLLQAVAGLLPIRRGKILLDGSPIHALPPWVRACQGLSFLQSQDHVFLSLTVKESLELAGVQTNGLDRLLGRRVADLSGGEKRRVALRTSCAPGKRCLLLDEPFSMLDREGVRDMKQGFLQHPRAAMLMAIPGTQRSNP